MSFPDRPPLHPLVCEQIDVMLYKIDEQHWPLIAAMRVKNVHPPDVPVPPPTPEHLRSRIRLYASILFKTEADHYEQFRSDSRYRRWLSDLAARTVTRTMKALDRLEGSNFLIEQFANHGLILGYHGLTTQGVEEELRIMLSELCGQYERGTAPGQHKNSISEPPNSEPIKPNATPSRAELRDSYLVAHPGVPILDICWAAGQRYTEWKRWLRGVLKDGSTPDRAFRALLESGKFPAQYKSRPRPRGWK